MQETKKKRTFYPLLFTIYHRSTGNSTTINFIIALIKRNPTGPSKTPAKENNFSPAKIEASIIAGST